MTGTDTEKTQVARKIGQSCSFAATAVLLLALIAGESGCGTLRSKGVIRVQRLSADSGQGRLGPGSTGVPEHLSVESAAMITRRHAEGKSPGARVLDAALALLENGTIVVGSCWDYVNHAYNDAGFTSKKRAVVWKEAESGPYIEPTLINPGDWIMFRNLTFGNIGHSSIFVEWIDLEKRSALTIEYAGQNRRMPGRFREYDITKCYCVLRGED